MVHKVAVRPMFVVNFEKNDEFIIIIIIVESRK